MPEPNFVAEPSTVARAGQCAMCNTYRQRYNGAKAVINVRAVGHFSFRICLKCMPKFIIAARAALDQIAEVAVVMAMKKGSRP
jgi:hypothetical protein